MFRENASPRGSVSTSTAVKHCVDVVQRLAHAHEHHVGGFFALALRRRRRRPPVRRRACTTCSTICAAVRFFRSPIFAVKQNWQFIAQPSCEETHTVVRPSGRRWTG